MNLHNIYTIARFESKLLKRSWLFRIFACLALIVISFTVLVDLTSTIDTYSEKWSKMALTSLMPFYTTYYYNIVQSVIVIFLAGNFLKRDKKMDTAEVIYVRPMSNADYIIGKTWGIVKTFFILNIITLAITAFFNIVINQSPFSVFPYLFYLITISLPSLLFVLGLSFTLMCLLKNQAVTFIIMLGTIGMVFFYVSDTLYGVFDFFGVNIPSIFSDVTGHVDLRLFLLQRSIFLLSGIGLICFTIALVNRLPHKPWKTIIIYILGVLFVLAGLTAGVLYVMHYNHQLDVRNKYASTFNKYAALNSATILANNLTITPLDKTLKGNSVLQIQNKLSTPLDNIILYLNPNLEVSSITSNGTKLSFAREDQVIIINKTLQSQEEISLNIDYHGDINESVCYTDVPEKDYLSNNLHKRIYRFGKRYAWLENTFTLLTPESLWYPSAVAPANPASPYNLKKNFTKYTLHVNYSGDKTVLSQGQSEKDGDKITFTNEFSLPGISLTIADYEKKSLQIDSVDYEILHFKGHDYFSEHFTELNDTLIHIIRDFKNEVEVARGRDYPFKKFVVAEIPIQFTSYTRNWKGYTEYIMPEIVFLPERNATRNYDLAMRKSRIKRYGNHDNSAPNETEIAIRCLNEFLNSTFIHENMEYGKEEFINSHNIAPMFFDHTGFIYSEEYPVLDVVMTAMQNTNVSTSFRWGRSFINDKQRANQHLADNSLQTAISNEDLKPEIFYELLKLKSSALKNYITTKVPLEEFNTFLKEFFQKHRFTNIPFEAFKQDFEARYKINLDEFLHEWYTVDHSPTVYVKDVDANKVIIDEVTKFQLKFKVNNPSDVNAIITAQPNQGGGRRRGPGGRGRGGSDNAAETFSYFIPKGEAREIKLIVDSRPANIIINTNISNNLPTELTFNFAKVKQIITDTSAGSFPISPDEFKPDPNDIIIDNDDTGFKIIESNNRNKLKELFEKEDEEEKDQYKNFRPWWAPTKWTPIAADYCYGETIHSAVYKRKGGGKNSILWSAEITKKGYYELFIWNPKPVRSRYGDNGERSQTYTIEYDGEKEAITIDLQTEDPGWISVGSFYLPTGTTSVSLTDALSGHGNYVIADAIKFTFTDK